MRSWSKRGSRKGLELTMRLENVGFLSCLWNSMFGRASRRGSIDSIQPTLIALIFLDLIMLGLVRGAVISNSVTLTLMLK